MSQPAPFTKLASQNCTKRSTPAPTDNIFLLYKIALLTPLTRSTCLLNQKLSLFCSLNETSDLQKHHPESRFSPSSIFQSKPRIENVKKYYRVEMWP